MEVIEEHTKTKSLLSVLTPIAQKITQLKQDCKGVVCEDHIILHLVKQCNILHSASQHLKEHLLLEAEKLKDEDLIKEISHSHQPLIKSIEGLTDSTKDLHRGDVSVKDNDEVWEELILFAEEILCSLIKILLSWDNARQRIIKNALDAFLKLVNSLKNASLDQLPILFEDIVDKVGDVFELIEERAADIYRRGQRECLFVLTLRLQKTLPCVAMVMTECFRQPTSRGAKICRDVVLKEVENLIENLKKEIGLGSQSYDLQEPAKYTKTMDDLFDLLTVRPGESGVERLPLLATMKSPVEAVLQHSMCVGLCVSPHEYSSLMTACENVLHQMRVLSKVENSQYPNPSDVDVILDVIVDVLETLETRVNAALIKLIVQSFADPFSTVESIIETLRNCTSHGSESEGVDDCVAALVTALEEEMDKVYQIGGLIIACIENPGKVRRIESSLSVLGWVESVLVASVKGARDRTSPSEVTPTMIWANQWMHQMVDFRTLIFLLVEKDAVVQVVKQEVHQIWAEVRQEAKSGVDSCALSRKANKAVLYARLLITLNKDSLYLTDVERTDLEKAILEVSKYGSLLGEGEAEAKKRNRLVKRLQVMLSTVSRICAAFTTRTLNQTPPEDDIYGCKIYEAGYIAAKKQFCKSEMSTNKKLVLSDICDVSVDVASDCSVPKNSSEEGAAAKGQNEGDHPLQGRNESSFQRIFKDRSLKLVRRNSGVTRHPRVQDIIDGVIGEDKGGNDTSIDITKFLLSRSTNTFRSSTRASKRNISLKVKEIGLDIGDVVTITPKFKAPKYIVPNPEMDTYEGSTSDDFTEALAKMERFTTTYASSISQGKGGKGDLRGTIGGRNNTREFRRSHIFYRTAHPIISSSNGIEKPRSDMEDCEEWKNLIARLTKPRVEDNTAQSVPREWADTAASQISKLSLDVSPPTELKKNLPVFSSSELLASITTPSSWEVDTPQRLEDIRCIQDRLASLNSVFKIDL